jgi:hypothetical protein
MRWIWAVIVIGLSFGTYRRHLTTALGRLARWPLDQEREPRAG